jgi:hypothetical protein
MRILPTLPIGGLTLNIRDSYTRGRDSSVGKVMDYGLDVRGSIHGRGKIFLSSPRRSDRL